MHPTPTPDWTAWAVQLAPLAKQWSFLPALLLGVGLSASSGLRAFLPLLALAAAFHFHAFGLQPTGNFAWLGSELALAALAIATIVEIAGDKIPVVDHALDTVGTVVRPAAGALVAGAVLNGSDPTTGALLGLIVGAPLALGVHGAKSGARGASTVGTFGFANPFISVMEDIVVVATIAAAFFVPVLVPLLLVVAVWLVWKIYRSLRESGEKHHRRRGRRRRAHAS
ncbi:hypothetical protein IAD21_01018 [Abditibacteriota bacterium]|nr:hypothetical protein IAD21_01018 [Abditibacteriota bacterium]